MILTEGGDPAHVMTRGQLFGELALLYNTPRTATVRAGSAASVWVLTRSVYQGILTGEAMDRTQTTIEQLRVQILKPFLLLNYVCVPWLERLVSPVHCFFCHWRGFLQPFL